MEWRGWQLGSATEGVCTKSAWRPLSGILGLLAAFMAAGGRTQGQVRRGLGSVTLASTAPDGGQGERRYLGALPRRWVLADCDGAGIQTGLSLPSVALVGSQTMCERTAMGVGQDVLS